MSHSSINPAIMGTPWPERCVGELVAERPGRSRIFQSRGIDFCCQGGRTLREACERRGIPVERVVEQLEAELSDAAAPRENPAALPPHELCRYIVETHHAYLRREFPRLRAMAERVVKVHGGHRPSLVQVHDVYSVLEQELDSHMMKEEQILFPAVAALGRGEDTTLPLDGPVACMLHEHDDAGAALARLRELTDGFRPPADACNTYRALFHGLQDLEEDLHRHIHLENSVLFPAALKMAAAA